ncbi:MAG: SCO family protein [bacterium]|nr:SCO family protein [bacterium]
MKYKALVVMLVLVPMFLFAQDGAANQEVGIDEQLGKFLPLELTFKNADGKEIILKDLITKPTVLSLVYFHCPTVCKPLLGAKTDVLDRIDMVPGKDYNALTISFNERETPENAKTIKDHFIKRFHSKKYPENAWHFLTGDEQNIKKLTEAVGFKFKRDGEDFIHPTGLIMISPKGKITRYLSGLTFPPFDVKLGFIEASEGKIGPTISKVLLYCFRYDPAGKRYVFDILKVTATVTIFFGLLFVLWLVTTSRKKKTKEKKS